jgi:poly-gamma-glutamate capsule biosynthesis protein CapA/YwtB (metallophosphatase superfamily)
MTLPGRTLAFAGDVMLGRTVARHIATHGRMAVWKDVLPALWSADLVLANLECALTRSSAEWRDGQRKAFYFRADPRAVEALTAAGIDFVSLANNHVLDFDVAGLRETIEVLDRAGIAHAGAGMDLASVERPARLIADGLRVAVIAYADHPEEWAATADRPGLRLIRVGSETDLDRLAGSLAEAHQGADLVVLSLHWGPNMRDRPSMEFRAFARAAVEAGADIVWGHSAHVVQGVEFHRGHPILYDTGELVDDYAIDPDLRNDLGALFLVHVREATVDEVVLLPLSISDMRVGRATGEDRSWFVHRITSLCAELGTAIDAEDDRIVARPGTRGAHRPAASGVRRARTI